MSAYSLTNQLENDQDVAKWSKFIESLQSGPIPKPYYLIDKLARPYLRGITSLRSILDIGCETGKNAKCLIGAGHKVTILDIAPNAIRYTQENLKSLGLDHGISDSINCKIENLDTGAYGPFMAVIGTYAFSFIPPDLFEKVMNEKVLGSVEPGGFFAGGFFGEEHVWAEDPSLTIVNRGRLENLLRSNDFTVCEMQEVKEEVSTVFEGRRLFHTIDVIAKRIIN